ncbi:SGNH hydrolase-type esterase domain-containing protein [Frankia sp. AiPs1]|uniref:hypothetical protein n=1 Tax=Frankia sp. AiPa1 TaxID=573492 RepID=UPI00202B72E6|nr:hypothetical protein [Frankia sp. AiPa1]MCL9758131.1 hypothetical protein [Frankia sp. AiPa1]
MTVLVVVALLVAAVLVSRPHGGGGTGNGGGGAGPALVVGDSVVALAGQAVGTGAVGTGAMGPGEAGAHDRSTAKGAVRLIGYPGLTPDVFGAAASSPLLASDLAAAGHPRTVVLNWNGNNPRALLGTTLVADYRAELTAQIRWYLDHGVTRVVLAAALPSVVNNAGRQVDWGSPASARPGAMLGSDRLNEMYRGLAGMFGASVRYSERAARAIHPSMAFSSALDGHLCIVDVIHPAPYCAARYAKALADLAHHPDDR